MTDIHVRPFLKWAGNKYRCLNNILQFLPNGGRLIEPFTGSGAIFLNSVYDSYLLGEENHDLVNLYNYLKQEGEAFVPVCQAYFTSENNNEAKYYNFRRKFNSTKDLKERAALFLYLNRHGFNGLCRYNSSGGYNVPFGRYAKPYFPYKEMLHFINKSQHSTFYHGDFRKTFELAEEGDVIYCDPPYAPIMQDSNFTSYVSKSFGEEEQIILAELAMKKAGKGVTVLISNHDTDFTRHHYREAELKQFSVVRSISCNHHTRGPVKELLAIFRS
jgi:DNA adenine methylase